MYPTRFRYFLMCVSPLLLLLWSCNHPNRYLIISEGSPEPEWESTEHRYVCLSPADAKNYPHLLALRTESDVLAYERRRTDGADPVEDVLFHLVRDDYPKASELLRRHEGVIPEYLRLLLDADLAYEEARNSVSTSHLIKQYQDAFDVQPCGISRAIIQLRIRQARYLR